MSKAKITHFSIKGKEGVTLHFSEPARLKTGTLKSREFWVSWDKIGEALVDDYDTTFTPKT